MDENIKKKIKQNAISLEGYNINELAWVKEDALSLINLIMNARLGILGGDVYRLAKNHLEPLYENWFCEQNKTETEDEYYLRTKIESLNFIQNFPETSDKVIIFSIVFTENFEN